MAAPMSGFSDHPAVLDVEIGHRLGLRWFRIDEERHGDVRVEHKIDAPTTAYCSCGSSAIVGWSNWDEWIGTHHKLRAGLSLHGARGRWQPGENVATCVEPDYHEQMGGVPGEVPHEQCGCGFWAYWNLGPKQVQPPTVAGIIKGYGDIIEGELGFRCSHAKILAVHPTAFEPTAALALEDAGYDVYSSMGAMLEMIKAPEGQPPLGIGSSREEYRSFGGPSMSWAAANATFHALGGSPTGTWHPGGGVTYTAPHVYAPKVLSPAEKAEKDRLCAERLQHWQEIKDLADRAATENRSFFPSEQNIWDNLNGLIDECDRKIAELRKP